MTKEFYSLEEIEKYYDEETNTYVFEENGEYIDLVVFNFDLDINARDIKADDINANDINADNISYYAVCFAHKNIKCKSIKSRRENAKHFVLDGVLEVRE